ncbi:MAG TPA: tetratricopeptide repeat protein [Myxococcota bacterium]|nr:tetratricopeptide repeat protein [Myxococcota bacterium]
MVNVRVQVFLALSLVLAAPGLQAGRPWKASVSVPATEGLGRRLLQLDAKTMKRFREIFGRGSLLLSRGRYREAAKALGQAIELYPDHLGARIARVRTLMVLGYLSWNAELIRTAIGDIRRAEERSPQNRQVRFLSRLLDGLLTRMRVYKKKTK